MVSSNTKCRNSKESHDRQSVPAPEAGHRPHAGRATGHGRRRKGTAPCAAKQPAVCLTKPADGPVLARRLPEPRPAGRTGPGPGPVRRPLPTRRVTVRRLLPPALVVAALAAGTCVALAQDKTVQLSIEGERRTLHTTADHVGELLAKEGIEVEEHDVVAPGPGAELHDGDTVAVRYRRPVTFNLDGRAVTSWTVQRTVRGALREAGVRAEGAYLSAPVSRGIDRRGLALDVRTAREFTLVADGVRRTVRTNAATVAEAVHRAGIRLRGEDTTSLALSAFPRAGQTVTVTRIRTATEVREQDVPFPVRRKKDGGLLRGSEVVQQEGRKGRERVTYRVRTVDGERQKPQRLHAERLREPRPEVVRTGTKKRPPAERPHRPAPGAPVHIPRSSGGPNWAALAQCESGGRPGAVDPSGTYGGLYQFDARTWQSLGGTGLPQHASPEEQTARAKQLYAKRGAQPWPVCGARL
ncbi:DUF348 domain-containing protein [Streptomyces sp. LD120]|uniref:DUF348 domain-containing protein n=1 Tax=Streptomyces physcomitrii TaxID=2724184 RepID=A0ABX1H0E4_9ACTN|nr:DUF348 domain-containing protein [Streptomyces physcomitrii]